MALDLQKNSPRKGLALAGGLMDNKVHVNDLVYPVDPFGQKD